MEAILFIAVMVGLVLALHKAREKGLYTVDGGLVGVSS